MKQVDFGIKGKSALIASEEEDLAKVVPWHWPAKV